MQRKKPRNKKERQRRWPVNASTNIGQKGRRKKNFKIAEAREKNGKDLTS